MKATTIRFPEYQGDQIGILKRKLGISQSEFVTDAIRKYLLEQATVHPELAALIQAQAQAELETALEEIRGKFGEEFVGRLYLPSSS